MQAITFLSRHASHDSRQVVHTTARQIAQTTPHVAILDLSSAISTSCPLPLYPCSGAPAAGSAVTAQAPLMMTAIEGLLTLIPNAAALSADGGLNVSKLIDFISGTDALSQLDFLLIDSNLDQLELAHFAALIAEHLVLLEWDQTVAAPTSGQSLKHHPVLAHSPLDPWRLDVSASIEPWQLVDHVVAKRHQDYH